MAARRHTAQNPAAPSPLLMLNPSQARPSVGDEPDRRGNIFRSLRPPEVTMVNLTSSSTGVKNVGRKLSNTAPYKGAAPATSKGSVPASKNALDKPRFVIASWRDRGGPAAARTGLWPSRAPRRRRCSLLVLDSGD